MKRKRKYEIGQLVRFAGKLYNIKSYKMAAFTGIEYELESQFPDKKTGKFELCFGIPEGFITK